MLNLVERPAIPVRGQPRDMRLLAVLIVAVAAAVLFVHWPALSARALALDDNQYLTENPLVQNPSWRSAGRFLAEVLQPSTVAGYYQPLAMISLMVDYALGGRPDDLRIFHCTSLALHVANTALVIGLLYLLLGHPWAAALAGLLFGVHPLTVEAIPWVGERKTLLATFFALWCLVLHVLNARRMDWRFYAGSLATCVLALLSKPTTTPLPLLLLVLDYWPLRRLSMSAVWEKVPFFLVGGLAAIITFISQSRSALTELPTEYGVARMPLILGHNLVFYLAKVVWPTHLSAYYPFPRPFAISNPAVLIGVLGTPLLAAAVLASLRSTRAVAAGALFFFLALFPTLGLIGFTTVIASDKYVYLPGVGLLLPLAALLAWLWGAAGTANAGRRAATVAVVLGAACALGGRARSYLSCWQDTTSLFQHMLRFAPEAPILHNNYGAVLANAGQLEAALDEYRTAVRLSPDFGMARTNVGIALSDLGRLDEAIAEFQGMVRAAPKNPVAHLNLANTLVRAQRRPEACVEFAEAVRLNPKYAAAYVNWGVALVEAGQFAKATERLDTALALNPDNSTARFNLGLALASQGHFAAAEAQYRDAIRLAPRDSREHTNLGLALIAQGKLPDAVECLRTALELNPRDALAHLNLGALAVRAGKPKTAELHFRAAVNVDPNSAEANSNLGTLLVQQGQPADGLPFLAEAVRLRPDYANARFMLGWSLAALGRYDEAIEHLTRAAELQPEDAEAYERLAAAYAATGRFDAATAAATRALELVQSAGNAAAAQRIEAQLAHYRQGQSSSSTSAPTSLPGAP